MLILLPPSETKSEATRGKAMDPTALSQPGLAAARTRVMAAVAAASERTDAARLLDVNPNLSALLHRNTRLGEAPSLRASDLYTGVLYEALDLASLEPAARRRATLWTLVFSPLYGVLRLNDRVAPYRVGICARPPGLDDLHREWQAPLAEVIPALAGRRGLVVDCRSGPYAAMWRPDRALAERWVQIKVPGASHGAKLTRGLVARAICAVGADPRRPADLADVLAAEGFQVELRPAVRPGHPWQLDVSAP